jgi:hypothetical protein
MTHHNNDNLDWLACKVLQVLRNTFGSDPEFVGYLAEKEERLRGKDRLDVLYWICGALDDRHLDALAKSIGVDPLEFRIALDVIRRL